MVANDLLKSAVQISARGNARERLYVQAYDAWFKGEAVTALEIFMQVLCCGGWLGGCISGCRGTGWGRRYASSILRISLR